MTSQEKLTRIAIVNADRCKPNKCNHECIKYCPVVRMGKFCIDVNEFSPVSIISEHLCIGCGICVKVLKKKHLIMNILNKNLNFFINFRSVRLKQ
jgi:translation initiation factor RLI1